MKGKPRVMALTPDYFSRAITGTSAPGLRTPVFVWDAAMLTWLQVETFACREDAVAYTAALNNSERLLFSAICGLQSRLNGGNFSSLTSEQHTSHQGEKKGIFQWLKTRARAKAA
jgi:hypothetical protein